MRVGYGKSTNIHNNQTAARATCLPLLPVKSQLKKSPSTSQSAKFTKLSPCSFVPLDTHPCRAWMKSCFPLLLFLHTSRASAPIKFELLPFPGRLLHPCSPQPHMLLGDHSRDMKLLCSPKLLQELHRASAEHSSPSQFHSCPFLVPPLPLPGLRRGDNCSPAPSLCTAPESGKAPGGFFSKDRGCW